MPHTPRKHILGGCSGQGRLAAGAEGGHGAGRVRPPRVAGLGDWRAVILLEVRLRQGTAGQQEAQPVLTTVLTARAPCSERRLPAPASLGEALRSPSINWTLFHSLINEALVCTGHL